MTMRPRFDPSGFDCTAPNEIRPGDAVILENGCTGVAWYKSGLTGWAVRIDTPPGTFATCVVYAKTTTLRKAKP